MESQMFKEFLQGLTAGLVESLKSVTSTLKSVEKCLDRAYQRAILEDRLKMKRYSDRINFKKPTSTKVPTVRNCSVHPAIGTRDKTRRCWVCNSKYHIMRNCPIKNRKKWRTPTSKSTPEQVKNKDEHRIALKSQHHALPNCNSRTKESINHTCEGDRDNGVLYPNRGKLKKEKLNRKVDVRDNTNNLGEIPEMERQKKTDKPRYVKDKITPAVNSITKDSPKTEKAKIKRVQSDSDSVELKAYVPLMTRKIAMLKVAMEQSMERSLLCSKNVGSRNYHSSSSELSQPVLPTGGQPVLPTRKYDTPSDSDSEEEGYETRKVHSGVKRDGGHTDSFKGLWFRNLLKT